MFRSSSTSTDFRSSLDRPLRDLLSVNSVPSALKSNFQPGSAIPARAKQPNPFGIRISAKCARNPIRMRSFKTQHLKSFRMRSYGKRGWGASLSACADPAFAGTIRVLDPVILSSQEGARCDE
jgi:hypothetical protein